MSLYLTSVLHQDYSSYAKPYDKIRRLVQEQKIFPVRRGLYEDNPKMPGYALASAVCSPSYLSFQYAPSWYGFIPEKIKSKSSRTGLAAIRTGMFPGMFSGMGSS